VTRYTFANMNQAVYKYEQRINYALRFAVERLLEAAQLTKAKGGRMPVDTGALRNSLMAELNGAKGAIGPDSYVFVAGAMKGGDFATFRWTMEYAAAVNNGNRGRPGAHFVEWAADQWQQFVNAGVAAAIARFP
jgi:hypothetical protein